MRKESLGKRIAEKDNCRKRPLQAKETLRTVPSGNLRSLKAPLKKSFFDKEIY